MFANPNPIVVISAGALVLVLGIGLILYSRTTRRWRTTVGKVVRRRLHWRVIGGNNQFRREICYAYVVDGHFHEATSLALPQIPGLHVESFINDAESDLFLATYPVGKEVRVLFDPRDPSKAVLNHKFNVVGLTLAVCVAVWLLTAIVVAEFG